MIKKTRPELYPLTAHGLEPREFVRRWNGMRNSFARELTAADLYGDPDVMDFGGAVQAVKAGHHVARDGWNGRGLYVTLQDGYPDGIELNANTSAATGLAEGTVAVFRPYLLLATPAWRPYGAPTADRPDGLGPVVPLQFVPWVPTVSDVLAEDWRMVLRPEQLQAAGVDADVASFGESRR